MAGSVRPPWLGWRLVCAGVRWRRRLPVSTRSVTAGRSSRAGGSSSPVTRRNLLGERGIVFGRVLKVADVGVEDAY